MRHLHENKETLQRKLYNYLKSKSQEYEGEISDELESYRQNMEILAQRKFTTVGLNNLFHKIDESQIIYLGDFHTFDQSPRNLKRILKLLISKNKKITLALELVHGQNQKAIQGFLENSITELEFLEEINYHESWRFPWKHYKVLFDEAKKGNVNIIGLNSEGTLTQRDDFAANTISQYIKRNPDHVIIVLFGEYHIAYNKLPILVEKQFSEELKSLIIYQNIDEVYWKLSPESREETQVIMYSSQEYSIQSSPPWIKYESMIYWFEHLCEDPDFDFHESILEEHANAFNENVFENFLYICEELNQHLQLNVSQEDLENFNLYDYHSLDFVLEDIEKNNSKKIQTFYSNLIAKGKSFKVFNKNAYYCSSYSINRLAFLAGIHLFTHSPNIIADENTLNSQDCDDIFEYLVLRNLFGYFCSKVINPYRKCDLYLDFKEKSQLQNSDQDFYKDVTEICEHISKKMAYTHLLEKNSLYDINLMSRSIGYMLGDILYDIHIEKGTNVLHEDLFIYLSLSPKIRDFSTFFLNIIPEDLLLKLQKSYF